MLTRLRWAAQDDGRKGHTQTAHTDDIFAVEYCPPMLLVTAGADGQVLGWNLNSGESLGRLDARPDAVHQLLYVRGKDLLIAAGCEGGSRIPARALARPHPLVPSLSRGVRAEGRFLGYNPHTRQLCMDVQSGHGYVCARWAPQPPHPV